MRRRARHDHHVAGRLDPDLARLPAAGALDRRRAGRRPEAADLGEGGDADADELALRARLVAPRERALVVELRERLVERRAVVARVVHGAGRGGEREGALGDEVPPPHLGRVELGCDCDLVHHPLDGVGRLGPARAAVRVGGHRVRVEANHLDREPLQRVAARHHQRREGRDRGPEEGRVRADVGEHAPAQRDELAVLLVGGLDLVDVAAAVGRVHQVLGARLGPLHGPPERARDPRQQTLFGVDGDLAAEAAADLGRDHADPHFGEAEALGELLLHEMRNLSRRPDRELLRPLVPAREDGAALHRDRRDLLVHELELHHAVGLFEELVDLGGVRGGHRQRHVVGVVGVDLALRGVEGALEVDHRAAGRDVDLHVQRRVARDVAVLGDDHRHRLADVADETVGEQRVLGVAPGLGPGDVRRAPDLAAQVVEGVRGDDALPRERLGQVDLLDLPRGVVAAHEGDVQHPVELQIVGVGRQAADQARILAPLDPLADGDGPHRHQRTSFATRAACCTAFTICW